MRELAPTLVEELTRFIEAEARHMASGIPYEFDGRTIMRISAGGGVEHQLWFRSQDNTQDIVFSWAYATKNFADFFVSGLRERPDLADFEMDDHEEGSLTMQLIMGNLKGWDIQK